MALRFLKINLIIGFLLVLLIFPIQTFAKTLSNTQKTTSVKKNTKSSSKGVTISPKFTAGKRSLRISFLGLQYASSVSYILTYETNGKPEGVQGSIKTTSKTAVREIRFGTCSSGVCTNHRNIKNIVLEVTSKLKSGKTAIKTFKLRI